MFAQLNDLGKALYGTVFPDGEVPVIFKDGVGAFLEDSQISDDVLLIEWQKLSSIQKTGIIRAAAQQFKTDFFKVYEEFSSKGLVPLPSRYFKL